MVMGYFMVPNLNIKPQISIRSPNIAISTTQVQRGDKNSFDMEVYKEWSIGMFVMHQNLYVDSGYSFD